MIPKIIHYCWFGGKPLPVEDQRYVTGWRHKCPDFKITKWSESNFPWRKYEFTRRAYHLHNWAAISDYVRLIVLKKYGGVYLDTDVKMLRSIEPLMKDRAFIGMENPRAIASGLIFGTHPNDPNVLALLKIYNQLAKQDDFDSLLNDQVYITTAHFYRFGFKFVDRKQIINGCVIYPTSYFCPKRLYQDLHTQIGPNTYTVHEYADTWSNDQNSHRQVTFDHDVKAKLKYYLKMMK